MSKNHLVTAPGNPLKPKHMVPHTATGKNNRGLNEGVVSRTSAIILALAFVIMVISQTTLQAQIRDHLPSQSVYQSVVSHTQSGSLFADWLRNMNMTMSHSYSMSFGSVNGSFQNVNAYTNTLNMQFSESLQGQVAISFLHSPFGSSPFGSPAGTNSFSRQNGLGGKVIIDHARLDYKLSENTSIRFEFSQRPYYGGMGSGYPYLSPFQRRAYGY